MAFGRLMPEAIAISEEALSKYTSRGPAWEAMRKQVLERDGYICQLQMRGCTNVATEADHIQPASLGGVDSLLNLRAACKNCNGKRGAPKVVRNTYINPRYLDFGTRGSA